MVMLPTSRRKAEEFAAALDGRSQPADPRLAALASLAEALRELPAGPAPDFRDQLRRRLVAVGTVAPHTVPAQPGTVAAPLGRRERVERPARPVQRRLRLATGLVAAATGLAAVSVGASTSLPGNPLYGLKRTAERVQLAAAGTDLDRGMRELGFATARLHEVAALAAGSATGRIDGTLDAMDDETASGARYLARDYQDHHRVAALSALHSFTVRQYDGLRALQPSLPAAAASRAGASLVTLASIDRLVFPVLRSAGGCAAGACAPQLPVPPGAGLPGVPGTGPQPAPSGATGPGSTHGSGGGPSGGAPGPVPTVTGAPATGGGDGGASGAPGGLGGLLGGSSSSSSGLPVPLPTSALPVPPPTTLPVPVPSVSVGLPGGGGVGVGPSPTAQPTGGTTSGPVTVCVPPLVLVNGACISLSLPPILP